MNAVFAPIIFIEGNIAMLYLIRFSADFGLPTARFFIFIHTPYTQRVYNVNSIFSCIIKLHN